MATQVSIVKQPLYGSVIWNGNNFIYTPNQGFIGNDFYIYNITDGITAQTITNYTNTSNIAPSASNIDVTVNASDELTINITDYVSDDGLMYPFRIKTVSKPKTGTVLFSDKVIKYVSNIYDGTDQFFYTITDGQYDSTGRISVTIINGADIQVPQEVLYLLNNLENTLVSTQLLTANWQSTYTVLCGSSADWNNLNPTRYNSVATVVELASSNWIELSAGKSSYDQTYTVVSTNSSDWNYVKNNIQPINALLSGNSGFWNTSYTILCGNSSKWNTTSSNLLNVTNVYNTYSASWNDVYNLVHDQSGGWDKSYYSNILNSNSANWDNSYNIICAGSANWNSNTTKINSLTSLYNQNSAYWQTAYSTVCSLSTGWGDQSAITLLSTTSANWNKVANSKPLYDSAVTILSTTSGDWDYVKNNFSSLLNTTTAYSGDWNNTYNTVCAGSANWNNGYNNFVSLSTNYSSNSGSWQNTYSIVCAGSAGWSDTTVYNLVTGQSGNWNNLLSAKPLYDSAVTILSTTSGDWNTVKDGFGVVSTIVQNSSSNWNNTYNIVCAGSANWNNGYNNFVSLSTNYSSNSGSWQNTYSIVCAGSAGWSDTTVYNLVTGQSGNWNNLLSAKPLYDSAVTILSTTSGDWNTVKNSFAPIVNIVSDGSANWNSAYTVVCANSTNWNNGYNNFVSLSTNYSSNSGSWQNTYTFVSGNSSKWGSVGMNDALSSSWNTSYNIVCGGSASWNSAYNVITDINSNYSSNSGNWNNAYNTVCAGSAGWSDTTVYNLVTGQSGNWNNLLSAKPLYDSAVTILSTTSGDWNTVKNSFAPIVNIVSDGSANWNSAYTVVCANSTNWNNITTAVTALSTDYITNSGNWQSSYALVCANSTYWNNTYTIDLVNSNYTNWNTSYNIVCAGSANWNLAVTNLTNLTIDYNLSSGNWNSYYNLVSANSSKWGDANAVSLITSQSAYYTAAYNTVCAGSANWNTVSASYVKYDSLYNNVSTNSGNWTNTSNLISTNSAAWISTNTAVTGTSSRWLYGDTGTNFTTNDLIVSGNAVFYGSLTADGQTTQINTNTVVTTAFSLYNTGNVDAIAVTKTTLTGAIANFSSGGNSVLYVDPNNKVGVNTSTPTEELTIVGNVSASGYVYGQLPPAYSLFLTNSGRYETASSYVNLSSVTINQLLTTFKPSYDTAYTYVTEVSTNINSFITVNKPLYDTAYTVVTSQSASVNNSYTFLTGNSAKIGTDTTYRAKSANYESAYSWVSANSGATVQTSQINVVFDGGGDAILGESYVMVQIPYNINITNWALLADSSNAITYVEILCSNYATYPTFSNKITPTIYADVNNIKVNNAVKAPLNATATTNITGWTTNIAADSLLKFNVVTNISATVLTLSLKCQKV